MKTNISKNRWEATGIVLKEPTLKKLSNDTVVARTILMTQSSEERCVFPVSAFNKNAYILCALAHKGSMIFAKGVIKTRESVTSIQAKRLVSIQFKITDFKVLLKEPIDFEEINFADTIAFYEPDSFMEGDEDGTI